MKVKEVTLVRGPNPWVRSFGSVFSCVRTARPGKHFLIETETEDGDLEIGSPPDEDYQQQKQQANVVGRVLPFNRDNIGTPMCKLLPLPSAICKPVAGFGPGPVTK